MFLRVIRSTSVLIRLVDAATASSSLIDCSFCNASASFCFLAFCVASHSALRFASAASCALRLAASSAFPDLSLPEAIDPEDISNTISFCFASGGSSGFAADGCFVVESVCVLPAFSKTGVFASAAGIAFLISSALRFGGVIFGLCTAGCCTAVWHLDCCGAFVDAAAGCCCRPAS